MLKFKRRSRFAVSSIVTMILTAVTYIIRLFRKTTIRNSTVPLFTILFSCVFAVICIVLMVLAVRALRKFFKRDLAQSRSKHIFHIFLLNLAFIGVMAFVSAPSIPLLIVYFIISTVLLAFSYI